MLGVVLLALGSAGCERGVSSGTASDASASRANDTATQATLDVLAAAVRREDAAAFAAAVDASDPAFAPYAERLYGLSRLPLTELRLRLRGPRTVLPADRRAALGPQAWAQTVTVTWRLTDDRGAAEHVLALAFRPGAGGVRIAGAQASPGATPLWWQQGVVARREDRVTVLAPDAAAAAAWSARGRDAVAAVARQLPGSLARDWPRSAVLEVPATRQAFERVLGVPAGSYAGLAAVSWPAGPDPARSALRVVVNPAQTARLDPVGLAVLLTHEVVHVATRSAASPAPTWLVEGYADYLAYAAHPGAKAAAEHALLATVRVSGPPRSLPADEDFRSDAPDLDRTYALARDLCRFIAETSSPAALGRLYRTVDEGQSLDAALRPVLATDAATLAVRWRRDLAARARGR